MGQQEDTSEKTNILSSDTFSGKLRAATSVPPALKVLMGPAGSVGKQWLLTEKDYLIGRTAECSIYIDDRSVSRSHAKLVVEGNKVLISDLQSANKTVINGKNLDPLVPFHLSDNDHIKLGNVILKFMEKGNLDSFVHQQLLEKASKDALTGIFGKRSLLEKGPESIKRADFLKENLCVIVLDIDHFKKINDSYGHDGGDFILKELAKIISHKVIRSEDFFARYGGEEFVVILSGAPLDQALEVAERIRSMIEHSTFEYHGKKIPITVSLGVAHRNSKEDWDSLFRRADESLYQSKREGRNRVSFK